MEERLVSLFLNWLEEDNQFWDVTTELLIPPNVTVEAKIVAKEEGVVACVDEAKVVLEKLGFNVDAYLKDGSNVKPGDPVLVFRGNAKKTLLIERTLLNLLMHCSGVATVAKRFVDKVKLINPKVKVAVTRKTLPGLRYFEKKAAFIAGCDVHRFNLNDMVLIKDNHVKIVGNVVDAIKRARLKASFTKLIEVEVSSVDEAVKAVEAGADIVMLDNFKPEEVGRTVEELVKRGLRDRVLIEVSGGVTLNNVEEYVKHDVDVVSVGSITHSAPALDMSLKVVEVFR